MSSQPVKHSVYHRLDEVSSLVKELAGDRRSCASPGLPFLSRDAIQQWYMLTPGWKVYDSSLNV